MAERKRSKDGSRDSEEYIDETTGEPGDEGRAGGTLARKIGTRDEEKRNTERPAGRTRVTGADERDHGSDRGDE
ncbi:MULTISPECIES: hypothetical protein [Roseobacteraceae]|jgi:hypothetical protein|uniref:Uncharacterized protein n=1 Tax=Roseovarius indicus TaxID=540747 RepID=A0A0T5P402_9RHOB|nr:hypothetical protein [Roseovarius indicus]KRS15864.1 hypothetical protein XM52_21470 [Roseovarius indicus]OAO06166.1 hypothetical protein A8B76_04110 [Roseovarius indicus]QEW26415.1 hypothetical protein RIdsm_02214 [Roseovarius indicus]SFE63395.1 hypothetical protein SAMN04488031_11469 [Roseovarius indicus]